MAKETIYLIGQISGRNEATYKWRQDVREYFSEYKEFFNIIDPCSTEWNKSITHFNSKSKTKMLSVMKDDDTELLVPKDYAYVLKSSGCIANFNEFDKDKPSIGTLFELAWYYAHPEKCVIGVYDGDWKKNPKCYHPFVRAAVNTWCKDHIEASELFKSYYYY